jgi:outer membrane protein assembly factor BamB
MHGSNTRLRVALSVTITLFMLAGAPPRPARAEGAPPATRAAKMDWQTWGYDTARTGHNPNETILGPSTVPGLRHLWTFPFAGKSDNAPVFAAGVSVHGVRTDIVYAGDRTGAFDAVNASDGSLVWSRNLGTEATPCFGVLGVTDTAVIDRSANRLYVVGGNGKLYALDLATGHVAPGWPLAITTFPNEYVWGAVTRFGGRLYIVVASGCDRGGTYYGRVVRVDPSTIEQTATFYVTDGPTSGVVGGGIWGWGGASADPANGNVYVATGNGYPVDPWEHYLYADAVVRLDGGLGVVSWNYPGLVGNDVDFGSTPVLYDAGRGCGPQFLVENKTGEILIYDRDDVGAGPVDRLRVSSSSIVGVAGWDPDVRRLYVGNPSDSPSGTYRHGLLAFKIGADCTLKLAWQKTVGNGGLSASPVTANGVVYFGDGGGHQLIAYDERTHAKLWSSRHVLTSSLQTEPIVVAGHVYLTSGSELHAFGL